MSRQQLINTLFVAGAIVALAGLTLFAVVDQPDGDGVANAESPQAAVDKSASVSALLGGLEARLEENPGDAKGWLLLARSYDHLGDSARAWDAYLRARELGTTDDALELKLAADLAGTLQD